ncbi:OmpA family protein [Nonlabens sp. Hel1_33_55]|uniref:OmpA family protein n=1 Tax=Nonlabens sp. Hel1_33_55 TaxID=1336802 RepID=UPI000875D2FE|nr:OmpA family protein [Nonlabens sp. Hel1_33_55]SCY17323.1 OmpA family protein [Nonlabens sp. Hel1_33_55]
MLDTINMKKLKLVLLIMIAFSSNQIFAQDANQDAKTETEGTIVMTESELKSLLTTIANARRVQLKRRDSIRNMNELDQLRLKYQDGNTRSTSNDLNSNQQMMRELRYLNNKIDDLSASRGNTMSSPGRDNSTIIIPGSNSAPANPYYSGSNGTTTTVIPSDQNKAQELKALQDQIDALNAEKARLATDAYQKSVADSLGGMNSRLMDVRRAMDSLEARMIASKKVDLIVDSKTDDTYFKQQVYFDNNSEVLKPEYTDYVRQLINILKEYPESRIQLEGWASPVGAASYNKQLSMRRALSVENVLLKNGIDQERILTSFRGEDNSSSEKLARRVDMSIIVK